MVERRQLTDEHVRHWREGCALLEQMTEREYVKGESDRYFEFLEINKKLTWRLVGPHSQSLFSPLLDGKPDEWSSEEYSQYVQEEEQRDFSIARTWRRALIEATGLTPRADLHRAIWADP
jgi:hypothetical protein